MKKIFVMLISMIPILAHSIPAVPAGDWQGTVKSVFVDHNYNRSSSFRVWISDFGNHDRDNCLATNGYVRVKIDGTGVNETSYQQLFSLVLAAQASGKTIALAGAGGDLSCENINSGWMTN